MAASPGFVDVGALELHCERHGAGPLPVLLSTMISSFLPPPLP